MLKTENYIIALSIFLLIGCGNHAKYKEIFTSEGKKGYTISCSGVDKDWSLCYHKAGNICEERGYEVLEVTGEAGTVTAVKSSTATTTTTHNRIMVIQCKPWPPGQEEPKRWLFN
jgi:hypothetical protein